MLEKRHSRRRFLKYAGVGIVAAAAALGYSQYAGKPSATTQTPIGTQTLTPTATAGNRAPEAAFVIGIDSVTGTTYYLSNLLCPEKGTQTSEPTDFTKHLPRGIPGGSPIWNINPTTDQIVKFLNLSTDPDNDNITYIWSLNDKEVNREKDLSTKLPEGENVVRLTVSDGKFESYVERAVNADPNYMFSTKESKKGVIKGISYCVGCRGDYSHEGETYKTNVGRYLTKEQVQMEVFDIISKELGCNGIRIYGDEDDRLIECARIAMEAGFDVIAISPMYISRGIDETIKRVGEIARRAQPLQQEHGNIVLVLGDELSIEVRGIYEGATWTDRVLEIPKRWNDRIYQKRLEKLLRDLVSVSREHFDGKLTYAAGVWEWMMPWEDLNLDILGTNDYFGQHGETENLTLMEQKALEHIWYFKKFNKPVWITEYGSHTFEGACKYGGSGLWYARGAKYSQDDQASCIKRYLEVFKKADIDGLFLWDFMWNTKWVPNVNGEEYDKWSIGILGYEGPPPQDNGDLPSSGYSSSRKKAFYMFKSFRHAGS